MKRKDGLYFLNNKELLTAKEARQMIRVLRKQRGKKIYIFIFDRQGGPCIIKEDIFEGISGIELMTKNDGGFILAGYSGVVQVVISEYGKVLYERPTGKLPNFPWQFIKMIQIILGDKTALRIKKKLEKK